MLRAERIADLSKAVIASSLNGIGRTPAIVNFALALGWLVDRFKVQRKHTNIHCPLVNADPRRVRLLT